jgi:DNA replication protein DnaC
MSTAIDFEQYRRGKPADPDGVVRCDCGAEMPQGRWTCDACKAKDEQASRERRAEDERGRMRARAERGPRTAPAWEGARVGSPTLEQWVRPKSFRLAAMKWTPAAGSLVLLGPTGCGKSTTAVAILWRLADDAFRACLEKRSGRELDVTGCAFWIAAYELVRARKEHPLGHGEAPTIERARDASILVLDDLGNEPPDTVIFELLDVRYLRGSPVIVTSGLDPSSIRERYGDALWRRIAERGTVLEGRGA